MTYSELLQQREWIAKSASIIQRDAFRCQKCGSIGYHSMSFCICKDSHDLDQMFEGWTFNELPFSSFIEKERNTSSQYQKCDPPINPYINYDYGDFKINGYGFYSFYAKELFDLRVWNAFCYCPMTLKEKPIYRRRFVNSESIKNFNDIVKCAIIKKSLKEEVFLFYGNAYIFDYNIVKDYIVSISDYIFPFTNGDIVISVSYKNFVCSFYVKRSHIKGLNVHHTYYIKGKAPWEYEDDALITLCEDCHQKAHQSNIPVYRSDKMLYANAINAITCDRCNGSGYLPQYAHVEEGVCFKCWGEGVMLESLE